MALPLVIAVLVASACGSVKSPSPSPAHPHNAAAPTPSSPTAKPAAAKPLVKIGLSALVLSAAPNFLAEDGRFFQKEGLRVVPVNLGNGAAAAVALKSGQVQFLEDSSGQVLHNREAGMNELAIAEDTNDVTIDITISKKVAQRLHVTSRTPIAQRIRDLKGLTMGETAPGSAAALVFDYLLALNHLKAGTDVKTVGLGTPSAQLEALQHGQIDGMMGSPPQSVQAVADGFGYILLSGSRGDMPALTNLPFTLFSTTAPYAKSHPTIVAKAARAVAMADVFMRQHPNRAANALSKQFSSVPLNILKKSIQELKPAYSQNGRFSKQGWSKAISLFRATGVIKKNMSSAEGVAWTNKFLSGP